MPKKILITGISGFIGRHATRQILQSKYEITAIVRPKTDLKRVEEFQEKVKFVELDLTDIPSLRNFLADNSFDIILHIGALRGGRKFSKDDYFKANVDATEQLIINAEKNKSRFIFCSSVGVFGAIPRELPAGKETPHQNDNYYHFTKNRAEALLQKYVLYGLQAVIVRPAISYGIGDFGFPFTLTKLIDKNLLFLPDRKVLIHLTNVELLAQTFNRLLEYDFISGTAYNVADANPIDLKELADFISKELKNKPYSHKKIISEKYFEIAEKIARFMKNELWITRFELISKSWFYDTENSYRDLNLKKISTIPTFKIVTDWYKTIKRK